MKNETLILLGILGLGFWYVSKSAGSGSGGGSTTNSAAPKPRERGLFETIGDLADRAWDAMTGGDDDDDSEMASSYDF
jgi:hypothetical protein